MGKPWMRLQSSFPVLWWLALALIQVAPGQGLSGGRENELVRQLGAARKAMQEGRLAQARADLAKLRQTYADSPDLNLQWGLLLGQTGDMPGAAAAFRRAIQLRPDWPEAHLNMGLILIADANGKRDWAGATSEFKEALRLRKGYYEAHRLLGAALLEQGKNEEAASEFRQALAGGQNAAEIHLDLGKALEKSGDAAEAEGEYRRATELGRDYAEARIALAKVIAAREPMEAMAQLRKALATNPDNATAQYALGQMLQRQGTRAEAQIAFRTAAALNNRQQQAVQCTRLSNEGLDAARRGEREPAIRKLREAVALRPDSAPAHFNFGLVLADGGDLAKGKEEVRKAISLAPADAHTYLTLGRMMMQTGEKGKARAAFERAVQLNPDDATAKRELLETGERAAGSKEGISQFEFGADANTAEAHFAFATVLSSQQEWVGAAGEWMRVLALRPSDVDARNNLGVSLARAGKIDLAELEFYKSLQVRPMSPGAHFGLAIVELERGNRVRAREELQAVVRVQADYPGAQKLLKEFAAEGR